MNTRFHIFWRSKQLMEDMIVSFSVILIDDATLHHHIQVTFSEAVGEQTY
jgi:hypothetical protein